MGFRKFTPVFGTVVANKDFSKEYVSVWHTALLHNIFLLVFLLALFGRVIALFLTGTNVLLLNHKHLFLFSQSVVQELVLGCTIFSLSIKVFLLSSLYFSAFYLLLTTRSFGMLLLFLCCSSYTRAPG